MTSEQLERKRANDRERQRKWRANNPGAWKSDPNHRERSRKGQQRFREKDPAAARERSRLSVQKIRLRNHGWTLEAFEAAWEAQDGKCAVCSRVMLRTGTKSESVAADHDHTTGLARGLVCTRCNAALARFEAFLRFLREGVPMQQELEAYLAKYSSRVGV